jgi:methylated-DNA-[protein]-cysteine S-methyltransferase
MASNPLPVVLPCHRVVKSDLSLGGYTAGVEVKRALLAYEGALCGGRPCRVARPRPVEDWGMALLESLGLR